MWAGVRGGCLGGRLLPNQMEKEILLERKCRVTGCILKNSLFSFPVQPCQGVDFSQFSLPGSTSTFIKRSPSDVVVVMQER